MEEGCQHVKCIEFRELVVPPAGPFFGVVPGASKDTKAYRYHMDFDKGMDKYRQARANGLQPRATTVAAVDEAEAEVASHKRALKKLGKLGDVGVELKTAKGVG